VGLFKRLKQGREQIEAAQEAMGGQDFGELIRAGMQSAAEMQQPGKMEEMMAYAQRAQVIANSGVITPATITSVDRDQPAAATAGGAPPGFGPAGEAPTAFPTASFSSTQVTMNVEVHPIGKPAYQASFKQAMTDQVLATLPPGTKINVCVDPNDPSSMLFWGMAA
jgi:hypothetical protein